MQRAASEFDAPVGTADQELAVMKCFDEFLALVGLCEGALGGINKALSFGGPALVRTSIHCLQRFLSFCTSKRVLTQVCLQKQLQWGTCPKW